MLIEQTTPLLEVSPPIARIVLNRPQHRNRLSQDDLGVLMASFERIERDPSIHVVVITGNVLAERPVFSSGFNMQEHGSASAGPSFGEVMDRLESLDRITVCALSGSVYGGSTDFALACDFAIGVRGMELRLPAVAIGLHYYPGGLTRWVGRVGVNQAKQVILTARTVRDTELHAMGYVQQLVAPSELDSAVDELVAQLVAVAPQTQRMLKASLNELARGERDPVLLERRHQQSLRSAEFEEGRRAFAERRLPSFGAV